MPKFTLVVLRLTVPAVPVPVKFTVCGLLEALSVKSSEALRLPVPDGVNVTLTVQVLVGVNVAPVQVSALLAKSPSLVPLSVTPVMARLVVPLLVTVSVCGALAVFTAWLVKDKAEAEKVATGPIPVPVKLTV